MLNPMELNDLVLSYLYFLHYFYLPCRKKLGRI